MIVGVRTGWLSVLRKQARQRAAIDKQAEPFLPPLHEQRDEIPAMA